MDAREDTDNPDVEKGGLIDGSSSPMSTIDSPMNDAPALLNRQSAAYRRPTTENHSDFWYISAEQWNELFSKAANSAKRKNVLNDILKFDAAGRIMETDEGIAAVEPCTNCSRDNLQVPCRVSAHGKGKACARCKRFRKSHCNASLTSRATSLEEGSTGLERQLEDTKEQLGGLKQELDAANQRITTLQTQQNNFEAGIKKAVHKFAEYVADI